MLVRRYRAIAIKSAYLIVGDEAEDTVQEAFVKCHRALARFDTSRSFLPWLLRIVRNEGLNRLKARGRRDQLRLRLRAADEVVPSAEAEVVTRASLRSLADALSACSEQERTLIACRFFFELSEVETAEVLGVRPGTVKSRLSRTLKRLRDALPHELESQR